MTLVIEAFSQQEYTGENRCLPCTAVNLVIAALATVVAAVAVLKVSTPDAAATAGVAVAGLSLLAIYLRGYLVPRTPTLTTRYLPSRVLTAFGKEPMIATGGNGEDGVDAEGILVEAGALEKCVDGEDLCLTDQFRTAWHEQIEANPAGDRLLAQLGIDCEDVTTDARGDGFRVFAGGNYVGTWESAAAFDADSAAAPVLADSLSEWTDLSTRERSQVLSGLRLFVDRCPSCRGSTQFGSETADSCCTNQNVMAVTCGDCGARLFETPVETIASDM